MPSWRLEPSAVKVARWVLRETALGNKCRPPDQYRLAQMLHCYYLVGFCLIKPKPQGYVVAVLVTKLCLVTQFSATSSVVLDGAGVFH